MSVENKTTALDAAAAAICERRNAPDWPCNGLDFDVEMARVALEAVGYPVEATAVTPEMIAAARHAWSAAQIHTTPDEILAAIYRAMRLARPLAEGPGV